MYAKHAKYAVYMETGELRKLIAEMRRIHGEPDLVEAKSGQGGYPKTVVDSIVAFANTNGGTIIIGVDEEQDFAVFGVQQPAAYRDAVINQARDGVVPPADVTVDIVDLDGDQVVVVDVPEAEASQKPLHLASKGPSTGALVRTGDGDRRMTAAEIGLLYSTRTQPVFDRQPIPGASFSDLDRGVLGRTLERIRSTAASLRTDDDETVLVRIGAAVRTDDVIHPTLAGLLAFGAYPQQWFPQLMVSFVSFAPDQSPERFLDNVTIRGSIPAMIAETVASVRRNLAARATVTGEGRADRLDFSLEAVREAVANALIHRDYSGITEGTQVQVELYPDRLVVRSPGGLYGPIALEELGEPGVSSSRNGTLVSLLSDTFIPGSDRLVAENRASGIPAIVRESRQLGQPRPEFDSSISSFTVSMSSSALLDDDVYRRIERLQIPGRTREKDIALAMLLRAPITNEMLREWGMDRIVAGGVLRDLVDIGVAVKRGGRRYASYVLDDSARAASEPTAERLQGDASDRARPVETLPSTESVFAVLRAEDRLSARVIAERTGLHRRTVLNVLNSAIDDGEVLPHGAPRSPQRTYSLWR